MEAVKCVKHPTEGNSVGILCTENNTNGVLGKECCRQISRAIVLELRDEGDGVDLFLPLDVISFLEGLLPKNSQEVRGW